MTGGEVVGMVRLENGRIFGGGNLPNYPLIGICYFWTREKLCK
jgi:hypothetical protein